MKIKKIALLVLVLVVVALVSAAFSAENNEGYSKALKYYHMKKFDKAAELLKEYVEKRPEPTAYYLLGYSLYQLGKYDEARMYFDQAYLVDSEHSLEKEGLIRKRPEARAATREAVPPVEMKEEKAPAAERPAEKKSEKEKAVPEKPGKDAKVGGAVKPVQPAQPQALAKAPGKDLSPQSGILPKNIPGLDELPPNFRERIMSFALIIAAVVLIFYLYFSLCLFFIAKKLNVSPAWTAWVPLVNLWTVVTAAGKPWWWILLLIFVPIIPFIGAIISAVLIVYIWMCITENLGRNKWLGLLMIVPIANFVWPAVLAFSGTQRPDDTSELAT